MTGRDAPSCPTLAVLAALPLSIAPERLPDGWARTDWGWTPSPKGSPGPPPDTHTVAAIETRLAIWASHIAKNHLDAGNVVVVALWAKGFTATLSARALRAVRLACPHPERWGDVAAGMVLGGIGAAPNTTKAWMDLRADVPDWAWGGPPPRRFVLPPTPQAPVRLWR